MLGHNAGDGLRKEASASERQRADCNGTLCSAAQRRDVCNRVADLGQCALQPQRQRRARRRGHHASCRSLEQRDADAVLHLAHRDAHGGLGDAEALGNRRHVVLLRERDERTNTSLMCQHAEYRSIAHAALVREGGELATRPLHFSMRSSCADEERAPIFRQQHPPGAAFEQLDAELVFELVNRTRNRRRGAKQGGTRPIRAALIGNREERSQVTQLRLHLFDG